MERDIPSSPEGRESSSPLVVNASQKYSSVRSQTKAVREFLKTGASHQGSTASTLQAILNYCFEHHRSFHLQWDAKTSTFSIFHDGVRNQARVVWEAAGTQKAGQEPSLLTAELGVIRVSISRHGSGWQLHKGASTYQLRAQTLKAAKEEATGFLRDKLTNVLAILTEEKKTEKHKS